MSTLIEAIIAFGYSAPRDIIMDGEMHRFATDQNKSYSKDGWYIAFDDSKGRAGSFGSWRDGSKTTWSNGAGRLLTRTELADIDKKIALKFEEAKKEKAEAAQRAKRLYEQASENGTSAYLAKKGIEQPAGCRFVSEMPSSAFGFKGECAITAMITPVYAPSGVIATLQIITDDGTKLFMKGGSTTGGWFPLGDWQSSKCVVIAEGLATAQSIHQASGLPVIAAFSANNLQKVALMARNKNALAEILIAVDGDKAGRDHSDIAAKSCNGKMIEATDGMDWNDVHQAEGLAVVRRAFVTEEINTLWKADLIVKQKADGTQVIVKCVSNFTTILQNSDEWKDVLSYDDFLYKIIPVKAPPINLNSGDELQTHHMTEVRASLEKNHFKDNLSKDVVNEAIVLAAMQKKSHQVIDYISHLKWDGVPRIETFLELVTGCKNDDVAYIRGVSTYLFMSAVNRIFEPGSKADAVVVFEGDQGIKKSTLVQELFYKKWCAAITSSFSDKDFYQNLRGKWCMVFDDLHCMKASDQNQMKAILSSEKDTYRASYAASPQDWLRQNIFIATTNDHRYLDDPTGARRWLPIFCVKIDIDYVKNNRDQLWAEAVAKRNTASEYWSVPNAALHQEDRQTIDPWENDINRYLDSLEERRLFGKKHIDVFPEEILKECLHIPIKELTKSNRSRVIGILTRLGYKESVPKDENGRSYKCYRKK